MGRLSIIGLSIILYTALTIYTPFKSAEVIDAIWQSIQSSREQGTAFVLTWDGLGKDILSLTTLYFFTWLFYYLQSFLMANVADMLVLNLRQQIAAKLNVLPLKFFEQNKSGEILSRVTNDLDKITETLQTGLLKLIVAAGTIIGSITVMIYYNVFLTVIFLIFMAISILITRAVAGKNLKSAALRQDSIGELTGIVEEYYTGRNIIKAYNREQERQH